MPRPEHDVVLATIRDFTDRAGVARLTVVLDRGDDTPPPFIECEPGGDLTVNEEHLVLWTELSGVTPLAVATPKPVPPTAITVDAVTGEVAAPIGVLEGLADAVLDLAGALGGRTVAVAEFATRDGDALSIAARPGEGVVLAIGDQQFELPGPAAQG